MADKTQTHFSDEARATLTAALSAIADGRASKAQLDGVMGAWTNDPVLRAQWTHFQLAGEALRSPEQPMLGTSTDEVFLSRFRTQMAQEPVVLAPGAWPSENDQTAGQRAQVSSKLRWLTPWVGSVAMAASFVFLMSGLVSFIRTDDATQMGRSATLASTVVSAQMVASTETPKWPLETAWSTPTGFIPVATGTVRPVPRQTAYAMSGTSFSDSAMMMPVVMSSIQP